MEIKIYLHSLVSLFIEVNLLNEKKNGYTMFLNKSYENTIFMCRSVTVFYGLQYKPIKFTFGTQSMPNIF